MSNNRVEVHRHRAGRELTTGIKLNNFLVALRQSSPPPDARFALTSITIGPRMPDDRRQPPVTDIFLAYDYVAVDGYTIFRTGKAGGGRGMPHLVGAFLDARPHWQDLWQSLCKALDTIFIYHFDFGFDALKTAKPDAAMDWWRRWLGQLPETRVTESTIRASVATTSVEMRRKRKRRKRGVTSTTDAHSAP